MWERGMEVERAVEEAKQTLEKRGKNEKKMGRGKKRRRVEEEEEEQGVKKAWDAPSGRTFLWPSIARK